MGHTRQRQVRQERGDRRPGNVASGQVAGGHIRGDQFILVEAVLAVGEDLQQDAPRGKQYQKRNII
jgi:hypothetical protein